MCVLVCVFSVNHHGCAGLSVHGGGVPVPSFPLTQPILGSLRSLQHTAASLRPQLWAENVLLIKAEH